MCNSNTEDTVCLKNKAHFRENIGHFPKNIGHYLENKAHFVRNKPLARGSKGLGLQYIWRKQKRKVGRSTNCESERKSWRCDSRFGKVRIISSHTRAHARTHYNRSFSFFTVTSVTITDSTLIYNNLYLSPRTKQRYYAVTDMV